MQFTTHEDSSEEVIWSLILNNLNSNLSTEASAAISSFYFLYSRCQSSEKV
ncbi:Hypothetical protein PMN2A_2163 [Prochlorococcus marinus str. NATL2A]|uniref:Uncharacterized protein n=1 Tax=Prochlorococcus marinus (strain NATL2A) TaxID=59920 RepID=A7MDZ5_PROMT|nr:Hypothetical protein PMN2A_2163 [Prochlorococcus marinus str. NATL2A]